MFNKKLKNQVLDLENKIGGVKHEVDDLKEKLINGNIINGSVRKTISLVGLFGEIEKINRKIEYILLNANLGDIGLIKEYLNIERVEKRAHMAKQKDR